jgi:hypothetical protein
MPNKNRPQPNIPIEERLWEAARLRLYNRGVSCPSKEEVNEEIDKFHSQEARDIRREAKDGRRFKLDCERHQE